MMDFNLNIPFVLASITFLVICLLFAGVLIHIGRVGEKKKLIEKIRANNEDWALTGMDVVDLENSEKPKGPFMKFLIALGLKTTPVNASDDSKTKLKFMRAGLYKKNILSIFWGTKILVATLLPMVFLILSVVISNNMTPVLILLLVIIFVLLGLILPDLWLSLKTRRREKKIERGLPDALDLLVVCVEAGMGLDAAIHQVGQEIGTSHPELGEELKLVNLELRAGKSRQNALRNLGERTGLENVKSLVTLLVQTDRFGTSVAQALRIYSDSFRTARYQQAEEVAAKMGTKLIFPLVLFIFPSLFVVILAPSMIQIYRILLQK